MWECTELGDGRHVRVADPDRYLVEFLPGGRLSVKADSNRMRGTYAVDGTPLSIRLGAGTMAMCPPDSQDAEFTRQLAAVSSWRIDDGRLVLGLADECRMALTAGSPTALAGTAWQVHGVNNCKHALVSAANAAPVTLEFGQDGMVGGSTGSIIYRGPHATEGKTLRVGPLRLTRMMCAEPEGVMEREAQYLAALEKAAAFTIEANRLEIRDAGSALQVTASN
jgi:heat shock protein HslJ